MNFVFRGNRGDVENGFPEYIPERRTLRVHSGSRPINGNSLLFLVTVLLLFMVLNSLQLSPTFLVWLLMGMFLMATSLRIYTICQQLQAQAHAHATTTTGLLGRTVLRLHMPPSIAFARERPNGLRLQLAFLDREFDDLEYDALRALDVDASPVVPSMTDEEINDLPVHKYKLITHHRGSTISHCDVPELQQHASASSSSSAAKEKKQGSNIPDVNNAKDADDGTTKNPEDELICSVCLELGSEGELIRSLPCFHQFHASCIDPWLRQQGTCPLCKYRARSRWHGRDEGNMDASYIL